MPRTAPPPSAGVLRSAALAVVLQRALELLETGTALSRDADLVQLVEVDVLLRGAVLRVVRCPLYATATQDVPVPAALERLGHDVLADAFRACSPAGAPRSDESVEDRSRAWLHRVAVAAAARWLSNQGEHEDPDEAYVAGLAHALCRAGADAAVRGCVRELRLGDRIEQVARLSSAAGTAEERAELVEGLQLDTPTRQLLRVVTRASALVASLGFGGSARSHAAPPDDGESAAVAEAVTLELAHAAGLLGMPPLPIAELVRELSRREARALAALPAGAAAGDGRAWSAAERIARFAEAQHQVVALRHAASIQEILDRGVAALHRGLAFDRIVVLEREHGNPSAARVRAVACRTHLPLPGPRSLAEVPLGADGALLEALDADRPLRSRPADAAASQILGAESFAVAPFRAGAGPAALLLADHFLTRRPLDDESVAALGVAAGALGLVLENAALHAEGKTLRALAEKDALTGINNRRNVLEILRREIDRARRYGKPLSIALIDVDHFKSWNDLHGHQVGDAVLQAVAQIISSTSREIDTCGRYGGEEFLVVLPETSAEHGVLYAERLRQAIEAHGADLAEHYQPASLSVSIGVTPLLARGDDPDHMIHRADTALYAAKEHGRNRVCVESGLGPPRPAVPPRTLSVLDEI